MAKDQKFSAKIVEALRKAKIIGVRSGSEHRYTGVWVVVVGNRVFARSWSDKPTGWFRAFKRNQRELFKLRRLKFPYKRSKCAVHAFSIQ